jgi:hypothetical protein
MSLKARSSLIRQNFYLLGFIGLFLLFVGILSVTYINRQVEPVESLLSRNRKNQVNKINQDAKKKMDAYQVVDRDKGLYRIPVTRAMELTLQAYQNASPHDAT